MNEQQKAVIRDCAAASAEARVSFAEVVQRLTAARIERYLVDFLRGETVYYAPGAEPHAIATHKAAEEPAAAFSAAGVAAAVRGAQSGLPYPDFCAQAMQAGCVGYHASLVGRRVVYYGRTGDSHVEWFPGAGPSQP